MDHPKKQLIVAGSSSILENHPNSCTVDPFLDVFKRDTCLGVLHFGRKPKGKRSKGQLKGNEPIKGSLSGWVQRETPNCRQNTASAWPSGRTSQLPHSWHLQSARMLRFDPEVDTSRGVPICSWSKGTSQIDGSLGGSLGNLVRMVQREPKAKPKSVLPRSYFDTTDVSKEDDE